MRKLLIAVPLLVLLLIGLMMAGLATRIIGGGPPSAGAMQDVPPGYLALYQAAADTCPGLPWPVLAAIGKVESDHGRSTAQGVAFGQNFAGAAGPMQFGVGGKAGNTWGGAPVHRVPPQLGYGTDGNGDGVADVYQPADAIFAAARYLCANGALRGADIPSAVFAYNHAPWYVTKVLAVASSYAAGPGVALPAGPVVEKAVAFAFSQLGVPYRWGATGEGYYDCSGLALRAYAQGGVALPRTSREQWYAGARVLNPDDLQPGDLVFFAHDLADPGSIHHVGIYIGAGNMIDAPHKGAVVSIRPALGRGDYIGAVRPTAGLAGSAPSTTTGAAPSTTTGTAPSTTTGAGSTPR
jgi:cell wall-associated NlpC family hydrolase